MTQPRLDVEHLSVNVRDANRSLVRDVSFTVEPGEAVGLIGPSGSGKTTLARSLLRLHASATLRITPDSCVRWRGEDLSRASERHLRSVRGRDVAMIFQEPATALQPVRRVGQQLDEVLRIHGVASANERRSRIVQALRQVGFARAEGCFTKYPHELSGGMRQRVLVAMALLGTPALLIADEPTSALDSLLQAQILDYLADLRRNQNLSLLWITHDLAVVASLCDRVLVLHEGRIVESAPTATLIASPQHEVTRALVRATARTASRGHH